MSASNIPHTILRNGWYTENYTDTLENAISSGEIVGNFGDGLISTATRGDYSAAAAAALVEEEVRSERVYELAGDTSFTMADFAAEIQNLSGRPVSYRNLSAEKYASELVAKGLSETAGTAYAAMNAAIAEGALFDDGHDLRRLIGRPTTPWQDTIKAALKDLDIRP